MRRGRTGTMKPSDLDAMPSDEYELDAPPAGATPPQPAAPLPRTWKADGSDPEVEAKPAKKGRAAGPGAPSGPVRGQTSAPSRKPGSSDGPSRDPKKGAPAPTTSDKSE